jgi:hypothetical protein
MRRLPVLLVLLPAAASLQAEEPKVILERAIRAHGGADNLARSQATGFSFHGKLGGGGVKGDMAGEWLVQPPDQQKVHIKYNFAELGDADIVLVMSGGKAWQKMNFQGTQQDMELTGPQRQPMLDMLHEANVRTLVPLLRDPKFTLKPLPDATVAGRPAVGLRASYPERTDVSLYFDRETHLLVKTSYGTRFDEGAGKEDGPVITYEMVYGDYREPGVAEEQLLNQAGIFKTDAASLRAYLAKQQVDPAALEKARALVKGLADESFAVREKSSEELIALGTPAIGVLQVAARDEDLEVSRRAQECLEKIRLRINPTTTRAAVRLLALHHPDGAAEPLLKLVPGADESVVADILAALTMLAERRPQRNDLPLALRGLDDGGPDPVLLRALNDPDPARRAAARAALGKDGGAYLNQPGRRLLLPGVRVPYRRSWVINGSQQMDLIVTEHQFFNRCEDREFVKP